MSSNKYTRAFAEANKLKVVRLTSGEDVLPIGPRKRAASKFNHLGSHAWYAGGTPAVWAVFVASPTAGGVGARLKAAGATEVRYRDGEVEARVPETLLLSLLDTVGGLCRPHRRIRRGPLSPERAAATIQHLQKAREAAKRAREDSR